MIYYVLFWVLLAWHYSLKCGFISDDHATVEKRKDIIPDTEKTPIKKPYWVNVFDQGIVMYYWDRAMEKLKINKQPWVWHTISLIIHLINVYLVWVFLRGIIGDNPALIAAFLWAVNPMLNQNVTWISGRPYILGFMLALIGMIFYKEAWAFIPLYGLAVITNISPTFAPILLKILYPHAWQPNLYLAVMIFIGAPFILWKFHKRFTVGLVLDRENFHFHKRKINALVRIYLYYLWTIIVPIRMGWYHQAGFRFNEKWCKINIYTVLAYIWVIWLMRQGTWGWWFILGVLPNANLFATNSFIQDRYIYFGSIALFVIAAPLFYNNPALLYIAATFYITRTYMHTRHLIDDERMYLENCRLHPHGGYAYNNLAFFLIQEKRLEEARVWCLKGIMSEPDSKMLWYNLGCTWAGMGHFNNDEGKSNFLKAVDCWKRCLQLEPRWRKPAEDLKTLLNLLIEKKVVTPNKNEGIPGAEITIPFLGDLKKNE